MDKELPYSWSRLAVGLLVFGAAAVLCGLGVSSYLASRPLNLRDTCLALADDIEQLLIMNRVPQRNIDRSSPEIQDLPGVSLCYVEFDVEVPDTVSKRGLVHIIDRAMLRHDVKIAGTASEAGLERIELAIGEYPFASIALRDASAHATSDSLLSPLGKQDLSPQCERVSATVRGVLDSMAGQGVTAQYFQPETNADETTTWTLQRIEAGLPADVPPESLKLNLEEALDGEGAHVKLYDGTFGTTRIELWCSGVITTIINIRAVTESTASSDLPFVQLPVVAETSLDAKAYTEAAPVIKEIPLDSWGLQESELGKELTGEPRVENPRVAIIVDDGGYYPEVTETILSLDPGLTLAILPDTPLGLDTARRAAVLGFEIMLHMPMENANMDCEIQTGMTGHEIEVLTRAALAQVPGAVGVNNHMGSVFTADETGMTDFLKVVQDQGLFFIDSRTTGATVAYDVARRLNMVAGARDVFLDHETRADYIREQFAHLIQVGKEQGQAIGICHFRPLTAEVLIELLPQFHTNGMRLVHVSELLK